jgi:uncharacterized membrane protein
MKTKGVLKALLVLSVIGVLFSGYMAYYTFATSHPACELFFFGMPSCFYGAIMYALIFLLSVSILLSKVKSKAILAMTVISFIGILFAGFLTIYVLNNLSCTSLDIAGIPPCVYGLVMYLLLLILAVKADKTIK